MQQRGALVPMLVHRIQAGTQRQQRAQHGGLAQLRRQDQQLPRRLAPTAAAPGSSHAVKTTAAAAATVRRWQADATSTAVHRSTGAGQAHL